MEVRPRFIEVEDTAGRSHHYLQKHVRRKENARGPGHLPHAQSSREEHRYERCERELHHGDDGQRQYIRRAAPVEHLGRPLGRRAQHNRNECEQIPSLLFPPEARIGHDVERHRQHHKLCQQYRCGINRHVSSILRLRDFISRQTRKPSGFAPYSLSLSAANTPWSVTTPVTSSGGVISKAG